MEEGVLAVLRGSADRVEIPEVRGAPGVAFRHGFAEEGLDRLGFAAQHGGLVRHADAFEMGEGIESRAGRASEVGEEFFAISAVDHEIGNGLGIREVENNQEMSLSILPQRARGGGAGFLVGRFAVDDRGHALGGILADAFPDAHHIAAGGVDDLASVGFHRIDHGDLCSECRDDHDILGLEADEVGIRRVGSERVNSQSLDLGVHIGVVNDFAEEKNPAVLENLASRISQIDGAFDAIAKAEFLREADGGVSRLKNSALRSDFFNELAAVVGLHLGLHMGHNLGGADIDSCGGVHDATGRAFTVSRAFPRKRLQTFEQINGIRP